VKGIQICLNEVNNPSPRVDNSERVKLHLIFLKIFFSRTSKPNSIILNTNYPAVKGIQICPDKEPGYLQKGRYSQKNEWGHLKILFLRTMKPEKLNFT
jgi:hypothetical protein